MFDVHFCSRLEAYLLSSAVKFMKLGYPEIQREESPKTVLTRDFKRGGRDPLLHTRTSPLRPPPTPHPPAMPQGGKTVSVMQGDIHCAVGWGLGGNTTGGGSGSPLLASPSPRRSGRCEQLDLRALFLFYRQLVVLQILRDCSWIVFYGCALFAVLLLISMPFR